MGASGCVTCHGYAPGEESLPKVSDNPETEEKEMINVADVDRLEKPEKRTLPRCRKAGLVPDRAHGFRNAA